MTLNERVTKLENQMTQLTNDFASIDKKLDAILSVSHISKQTGNFIIDNLPRIIGGIVAGLTGLGIFAAGNSDKISAVIGN